MSVSLTYETVRQKIMERFKKRKSEKFLSSFQASERTKSNNKRYSRN